MGRNLLKSLVQYGIMKGSVDAVTNNATNAVVIELRAMRAQVSRFGSPGQTDIKSSKAALVPTTPSPKITRAVNRGIAIQTTASVRKNNLGCSVTLWSASGPNRSAPPNKAEKVAAPESTIKMVKMCSTPGRPESSLYLECSGSGGSTGAGEAFRR